MRCEYNRGSGSPSRRRGGVSDSRRGKAWHGEAGSGKAWTRGRARRGWAWQGEAWHGKARDVPGRVGATLPGLRYRESNVSNPRVAEHENPPRNYGAIGYAMSVFFTSDQHFNHRGILKHCSPTRPWDTVPAMNAGIIERWNNVVTRERDEVWVLGDFGFHTADGQDLGEIFWKLRGRKSLVVGNHDEKNPTVLKLPWERIERLHTYKGDAGHRAELCHYPLETWKGSWRGAMMLHGHCHGTLQRQLPKRFDVGIDVEGAPVSWEDLVERAAAQVFVPVDGHGANRATL